MKTSTQWTIGIGIGLIVLFLLPFLWRLVFPAYGMMGGYGYGYHMPMMGYGFFPFLGMIFMWLFPLGLLTLIGLGIAWLVKQVTSK